MVVALLQVMSVVRGLCKRGITICATIHCPPPHTFTLFDRSLIMQRGRTAYFGLNGQPAIDYFYNHFDKVGPGSTHAPVRCLALTDKQGWHWISSSTVSNVTLVMRIRHFQIMMSSS